MQQEMPRSFVAVEFPESVHQECARLRESLSADLRGVSWVKQGNIHLTLEFLGDITLSQKDRLTETLCESVAYHTSFNVELGRVGVFPNWRRPRVLWLGVHVGQESLLSLADTVRRTVGQAGIKTDGKPFRPHLTLARIRRPVDLTSLESKVDRYTHLNLKPVRVDHITLMQSVLHPQGAVYTPLAIIPLAGN